MPAQLALDARSTSKWSPSDRSEALAGPPTQSLLPPPWAPRAMAGLGEFAQYVRWPRAEGSKPEDHTTLKPSEAELTQTQLPTATT